MAKIVTIDWNQSVEVAYALMQEGRLRHLPATNSRGEIVGMLSDRDVRRAMIPKIENETLSPSAGEPAKFESRSIVRDYMSWPVLRVEQTEDLRTVTLRMLREKVSSLLVQDAGRTVGIVTTEDLLSLLADLLADPKSNINRSLQDLLARA